jgi:hypothetical protein
MPGGIQSKPMLKKRYRSAAERDLWHGMLDTGEHSRCDLSDLGLPARRHEWRLALFVSLALMTFVSLYWLH